MRGGDSGAEAPRSGYNPTRRTALILSGEGTSLAYLAGAVKALRAAGVRIDLTLAKGSASVTAVFSALRAADRLTGDQGLLAHFPARPYRLEPHLKVVLVFVAASAGVFLAPAVAMLVAMLLVPVIAGLQIVLPQTIAGLLAPLSEWILPSVLIAEPAYVRLLALGSVLAFGFVLLVTVRDTARYRDWSRGWLDRGVIHLDPLIQHVERSLWLAVRGPRSTERPENPKQMGEGLRQLLAAGIGQHGFSELIFYALDLDGGQEVPFVFLKDRYLESFRNRGPGRGGFLAEPVDLASSDGSAQFFAALSAAMTPPAIHRSSTVRLPPGARNGGEVHRFCSSLFAGHSALADALAAGAEQVIYITGAANGEPRRRGALESLVESTLRQAFEADMRWAQSESDLPVFVIRPEKSRLGTYQFEGEQLLDGDRLEWSTMVAHGERDALRLFIEPILGEAFSSSVRPETSSSTRESFRGPREWS